MDWQVNWPEHSGQVVIAYSGGLDSRLLLELAAQHYPQQTLLVVHVHHGLSPNADFWAQHCANTCAQLGLTLQLELLPPRTSDGSNLEAWARNERYQRLAAALQPGGLLLTGHHLDDQAETLVLQLCRGAGIKGLAAMAPFQVWQQGWLARPFLGLSRAQLLQQAQNLGLSWIEDESNYNSAFDRNLLRQQVWPLLQQRYPSLSACISRSAEHCQEAQGLLDELAATDLGTTTGPVLALAVLRPLSPSRQRNLLRYWLDQQGALLPSQAQLQQIQNLLMARPDNQAQIEWGDWQLRYSQDALWLLPRSLTPVADWQLEFSYQGQTHYSLPSPVGTIAWQQLINQGLKPPTLGTLIQFRNRRGGERLQPAGRQNSHSLKKLLQQQAIPAWQRQSLVLVYYADELVAVSGLWISHGWLAQ